MCHSLIIKLLCVLKIGNKCLNETTEVVGDIKRPLSSPSLQADFKVQVKSKVAN